MKKLSNALGTTILMGCRQAGSYNPDEVLPRIEEHLNAKEYKAIRGFLAWVHEGVTTNPDVYPGRRFGYNINQRYAEYLQSK